MSVEPALWDAFYKAKDALLSALDASLTQPNCQHILLQPVERAKARTSIKRSLERLHSGIRELESAQADITRMHDRFLKSVGRVQSSLSPVGVLPPELLREVILRSAGPQDHKRILALASVCDQWRTAVHAERSLWVDANWDSWPAPLLELWCSRVRGHPMAVRLGMKGIKSTSDEAYARILQSTKPFWDVLHVDLAHKRLAESRCVSASEFLFKDNLPSLRELYFHMEMPLAMGFGATPRAILAPNVRDIKWRGSIPLGASESFTSLRTISFFPRNEIQWRKWLSIFSASSRLEHLEVDFRGTFGGVRPLPESPLPAATLPSLLSLTINSANPPDLRRGFQDVYIPNLREIFLDDHLQPDHFSSTLARLVSAIVWCVFHTDDQCSLFPVVTYGALHYESQD